MKDNLPKYNRLFFNNFSLNYLDLIRNKNHKAFTRNRKVTPINLLLQMFAQKGQTQYSELLNFYKDIEKPLDISAVGFYKARMNFNPEAIRVMTNDFVYNIYEKENDSMVKLNNYIITAIDGSDIILPSLKENYIKYGSPTNDINRENKNPVMGKVSILYDCINKCVLDSRVGKYKHSEIDFATKHLETLHENLKNETITIFDRGYYCIKLVIKMIENKQKFLFRLSKKTLKSYQEDMNCGDDKNISVKYTKEAINYYNNEPNLKEYLKSTTFDFRMVKILVNDNGASTEEVLLTNLSKEEFDLIALKELYHLRWNIETAYNIMKNRMKLEEFSGYRETLFLQDIYSTIWIYNMTMLFILEVNEKDEIPQERYKNEMKRNVNQIIGIVKTYYVRMVVHLSLESPLSNLDNDIYMNLIKTSLVPVRKNRKYPRKTPVNKSRMSYRYTY